MDLYRWIQNHISRNLDKIYYQYRKFKKYKKFKLYAFDFDETFSITIYHNAKGFVQFISYKGHYVLIIGLIFYDLLFNNLEIKVFYTYIAYIFIYDVYIKVVRFITQLHINSDNLISRFLYCKQAYLVDKNYAYFGEDLIDLNHFRNIYQYYIKHGFKYDETNYDKI